MAWKKNFLPLTEELPLSSDLAFLPGRIVGRRRCPLQSVGLKTSRILAAPGNHGRGIGGSVGGPPHWDGTIFAYIRFSPFIHAHLTIDSASDPCR
jgi:hypothetical protein